MKNKNGKLFVISAPSGAGKTTLTNEVIKRLIPEINISKVRTTTTRHPRPKEVAGKDYNFISKEEFIKKNKEGFFLETTEYNGNFYGSPSSIIKDLKNGRSFIIIADLPGVKELKKAIPFAKFLWITTPTLKELKRRLLKRETTEKNHVKKRLELAEKEITEAQKSRIFDFNIINDVFEKTVEEICQLIKNELTK